MQRLEILNVFEVHCLVESSLKELQTIAAKCRKVKLVPAVPMRNIVTFINRCDVGLFLCQPSNSNLRYALPNKLFEFIQGRLAVAIGPSIEMKKIVDAYDCGIVSDSFDPRALADGLNQLTREKIMYYKQRSHVAAQVLNSESSRIQIENLVRDVLAVRTEKVL